jgi:hypothetical protein
MNLTGLVIVVDMPFGGPLQTDGASAAGCFNHGPELSHGQVVFLLE